MRSLFECSLALFLPLLVHGATGDETDRRTTAHTSNVRRRNLMQLPHAAPGGEEQQNGPIHDESSNDVDSMESHLANVWESYDRSRDVPFFWQIPKSGTTNALAYFSLCMDLVKSTRVGALYEERNDQERVRVVEFRGHKYVNVDTSSTRGLAKAHEMHLEQSPLVDVVVSGLIHDVPHTLFSKQHRGRLLALLRDPVARMTSIFYHVKEATNEPTFRPEMADWNLQQFAQSELFDGNWMTRMIVNKAQNEELNADDVQAAKDFLRSKCLVGLQSEMNESLDRFQKFFGWELEERTINGSVLTGEQCKDLFFHPDAEELERTAAAKSRHITFAPGSPQHSLLTQKCQFDIELYNYAQVLFQEQAMLME